METACIHELWQSLFLFAKHAGFMVIIKILVTIQYVIVQQIKRKDAKTQRKRN